MDVVFKNNYFKVLICLEILFGFLGMSFALFADETDLETSNKKTLEKVVITGSRNERVLSNAPVKTELVEKDTIQKFHASDASQVLDYIPGITLQGMTGRMGKSAVIQGLGDDHVLVLIDGIPQLQTSSSGYDLSQLNVNDIERVEVVKGGASALYGSQAMGGVINILTKKPKDKTEYFVDLKNTHVSTEQTERDPSLPNVINGTLSGKARDFLKYKLSYGYRNLGAIDLDTNTFAQDRGAHKSHNSSMYLSKDIFKKSDIYLDYRFIDERIDSKISQVSSSGYQPHERNSATRTQSVTLGLNSTLSDETSFKMNAFYSQVADHLILDNLQTNHLENIKSSDLNTVRLEGQLDTALIGDQITTLGFLYNYQFMDILNRDSSETGEALNNDVDHKNVYSLESYIQHSFVKNKFELTPGVRGQYDSGFGGNFSPSLNSIYSPNLLKNHKTNFRSSIGTGYKVPTLKERFYMMDHRAIAGYIIYGTESLDPESSVSFQTSFEIMKSDKYRFYINGFINNVRDKIGVVIETDPNGTMIFNYQNIGEILTQGVEVSTMFHIFGRLNMEQDITFLKAEDRKTNNMEPFRPQMVYKTRLNYKANKDLDLIGIFRYQSDQYVDQTNIEISPSYSVLDLKVNYQYNKQLNLYAGVDNVLDITRRPAQDGVFIASDLRPDTGRQYYMGLSFREL